MALDDSSRSERARGGVVDQPRDESRVLLFMQPGRDRELLRETLDSHYQVSTATDVDDLDTDFDCCVLDAPAFDSVAGTAQRRRASDEAVFLPFVLLLGEGTIDTATEDVYDYVDDVVELPVRKAALLARIRNLVDRRQTALELAARERELEETVDDLRLKEQAIDAAPVGVTIAEASDGDGEPLSYVNEHFQTLTGYSSSKLGEDCRFLQGDETNPETRARIREAIAAERPISVDILNYRKNGEKFWNKLDVAPVRDSEGTVNQYVGFQMDITDRKIRERRLEVLNRLLSHNLRNKMNLIDGHVGLLKNEFDDEAIPQSLTEVEETAVSLMDLAETVRNVERITDTTESPTDSVKLTDQVSQAVSAFQDRFPDVTYEVTLPEDDACEVAVSGLTTAIEEAIENATRHNDDPDPVVAIRLSRKSGDWIEIEVEDNGPGMPDHEIEVLEEGETPVKHGNRLGVWLMYWVVSKAGGHFSVSEADPNGTVVSLSVPAYRDESTSASSP